MLSIGEILIFGFEYPDMRYWKGLRECQSGNHNRTISLTNKKNRICGQSARTV